ncbi:MAG: tetratricopeptide repeat protein [Saprospiraceae bacterium]|nr:tetratricopeptide repeat protein [Saprospiraceae bacterium]
MRTFLIGFFLLFSGWCLGQELDTALARVYLDSAKVLIGKEDYNIAFLLAEKAKRIYEQRLGDKTVEVADALHQMGRCKSGDEALEIYAKSLHVRKALLNETHLSFANTYYNIGMLYDEKGDFEQVINYTEKALDIWLKNYAGNHPDVADAYNNLGRAYDSKGEFEKALGYYKKALKIYLKIHGGDHPDVADVYNNLGITYYSKGEFDKALGYYEKALQIYLKVYGENHPNLAMSYNNLGVTYESKGEYDKALGYYEKALKIRIRVYGGDHPDVATAYNNLGVTYDSKGEYDKALGYYEKALKIRIRVYGRDHPDVATAYNNLGVTYESKGEYDKALGYKEKALKIRIRVYGGNHPDVATAYNNLGNTYESKREYDKALGNYERALKIYLKGYGGNHPDVAMAYNNLGYGYLNKSQFDLAGNCFQKALSANNYENLNFDEVLSNNELLSTFENLLILGINRYNATQNWQYLEKAVEVAEQSLHFLNYLQSHYINKENKLVWNGKVRSLLEQVLLVSLIKAEKGEPDLKKEMLSYTEQNKSTILKAQLKDVEALKFAGVPEEILEQENDLRINITYYDKKRQEKLGQGIGETDSSILSLSGKLFALKQDYEFLQQTLKSKYPEYFRLKYDYAVVDVKEIQEGLQSNQALIEYFTGDSSLFIFTITPRDFEVYEVKKNFPLEKWVQELRESIYRYWVVPDQSLDSYKEGNRKYADVAYKLYQKLVAPITLELPERLIVVPDGVLGYLPFDVLLTQRPDDLENLKTYPYLLKEHQVSYAYSATLLEEMRNKKHKATKSFFAMAPSFPGEPIASRNITDIRRSLGKLRFNKEEVEDIRQLIGGDIITGEQATLASFLKNAGKYRILHLSTHGKADDRVGDYSFLAFHLSGDSLDNGKLYIRDLYNLRLNADMVVLSACETGFGELQRGEGILSMARGFAFAGAKSIVNSLWSVDDKSTKEIMARFYYHLKKGKDKDAALRLAKLDYLEHTNRPDPFFWAAFVPVGDMSPVKLNSVWDYWPWLLLAGSAVLLYIFLYRRKK